METILWEINSCLVSASTGLFLGMLYDVLRIFRRVIIHRYRWMRDIEDILYGMATGFIVFATVYRINYGIMRGFFVLALFMGMLIYKRSLSDYLVNIISKIFVIVLKPLKKLIGLIRIRLMMVGMSAKGKTDEA